MSQTLYHIDISDKQSAEKLVVDTINITGVRWVNVNCTERTVVVTHDDNYDEAAFKAIAGI